MKLELQRRSREDKNDKVKDGDGDDPTKCLDWPCSNPHTPRSSSDDEVLTLQSLVPKVNFHWAWPGLRKMRSTAMDTDGTRTGRKLSQEVLGDDPRGWPGAWRGTAGGKPMSKVKRWR